MWCTEPGSADEAQHPGSLVNGLALREGIGLGGDAMVASKVRQSRIPDATAGEIVTLWPFDDGGSCP
jgi:hypothetical protein